MIPFFRRNGRLMLAGIAVSLFCFALSALFTAQSAVPTGSWGLSFRTEGQPPIGNATAAALRTYDAVSVVLQAREVPAAFFVVGNYLQTAPELVQRMADEGHLVGNHTEHHWDMSRIADRETFRKELETVEEQYRELTGQEMEKFYRPPQGVYSEENLRMAKELGYKTVFWSLAYVDWYQDDQPTKEQAFSRLIPRIQPGAVVLLHSTSKTNGEILDELLTKWEEMGYTFHPLSELCEK